MVNWKVRFSNKFWVVAFVSQLFILAEILLIGAHAAGLTDFQITESMKEWLFLLINAIFGVLATLGVVQDPTTEGMEDSSRAKRYSEPQ
ncbi:phage holin [Mesobacillus subterraneus]|uniref:phage holin n=1 Tax=Mesobacillus subterraneus TaxID=285983 RepID=UPI00203ED7C3|nr:phage holin [Mesobacillus subterraneus]MCM3665500.1 phage holin [Mesobacillus subterraneus]MCM3686059.1 phage holin [Mesobacillus subterraneus]